MSDTAAPKGSDPQAQGEEGLSEAAVITTHRVLEAFGSDPETLDILRSDIFDSRPRVVISALLGLRTVGDKGCTALVSRLFSNSDPDIAISAVQTVGAVAAPDSLPMLLEFSASARQESVKVEALRTLAKAFPRSPEVRNLVSTFSRSSAIRPEARASVLEILFQLEDEEDIRAAIELAKQDAELVGRLIQCAQGDEIRTRLVVSQFVGSHGRMPLDLRISLLPLAAPLATKEAVGIFFESLRDTDPRIRQECYRLIGAFPTQVAFFDRLAGILAETVENDQSLEEETLQAIDRMVEAWRTTEKHPEMPSLARFPSVITALFGQIRTACEHDIDTSHETGWQIANAKEYIEFYLSEESKKTILQLLKGGTGSSLKEQCSDLLKESAVKVEVRHFDGYKVMRELLDTPNRSGIALFIRHLSLAKTENRGILCRLKRALSLVRMAPPGGGGAAGKLYSAVFSWARASKLYRLAERALFALHCFMPQEALSACRVCMTPPVTSKILAITAVSLVKDMNLAEMEPAVINLLHENDRYVQLALLDALLAADESLGEGLLRAILQRFVGETDRETAAKLADLLGAKADVGIACAIVDVFERMEEWKRVLTLVMIRRVVKRAAPVKEQVLSEFLYRVLRADPPSVLARVPAVLFALVDDYSAKVFSDVILRVSGDDRLELLRDIREDLRPDIIGPVWALLREPDVRLLETMAEILPRATDERSKKALLDLAKSVRRGAGTEQEPIADSIGSGQKAAVSTEKDAYRFEREHVRPCAVVFSDIVGYSTKAQDLSSLEVSSLIQEYESILLPIMEAHEGTMVKRMGDGHLFTFSKPLLSVLATIRVQKALARFNRFRPEKMRVFVRIGIHWGEVVEKIGDVFGNTVNIAARLQTVAKGGSICISHDLFEKVSKWITANDLGPVMVKGIRDPIRAYEPIEISLELPAELDPLKNEGQHPAAPADAPPGPAKPQASPQAFDDMLRFLMETFQGFRRLARQHAASAEAAKLFDGEILKSWKKLQALAARARKAQGG